MKKTNTNAPTEAIISLAELTAMPDTDRITLYRRCDAEMRSRFLIQGKILHTLEEGEDALRTAGIPRSSLHNAKLAAIALHLTEGRDGKPVLIHRGGKKPVPFTEEVYDQLTLEQCRLIACGCTTRGQVTHRPMPDTFYAILKGAEWETELEHYFEHGMIRAVKQARDEEAAKRTALQIPSPAEMPPVSAAPAAPVIVSAPAPEPSVSSDNSPPNVVPFPTDEGAETGHIVDSTEITSPGGPTPLESTDSADYAVVSDAVDYLSDLLSHLDPSVTTGERHDLAHRLRTLADSLSATCADSPELPKQAVKAGKKSRKAA